MFTKIYEQLFPQYSNNNIHHHTTIIICMVILSIKQEQQFLKLQQFLPQPTQINNHFHNQTTTHWHSQNNHFDSQIKKAHNKNIGYRYLI